MQSLWRDEDAGRLTTPLDLRVYTSRLLGREPALVLHGGGNTSVKTRLTTLFGDEEEIIYVKGSGWDLATIQPAGFAPVRLDPLRRMAALPALSDTEMVRWQRAAMIDPNAPTPSVEAILHAIIPFDYVDHTHADAVVAVSNTPDGPARIAAIYGNRVLVVPYVMPGFVLAKAVRELVRSLDWSRTDGIILLNHGVFSFGPDARTSYERMIALVSKAEDHLRSAGAGLEPTTSLGARLSDQHLEPLARLRRAVGSARGRPVIAQVDGGATARQLADRPNLEGVASRGPLTPDHVIRTKPLPLAAGGNWEEALANYGARYQEYFARNATINHQPLDPAPRWIVWPGVGSVGIGDSPKDAGIVLDIARHTARAIDWAEGLGGWRALPETDLFQVEYWELEQAKLGKGSTPPLRGKVALVTGAARGIGRGIAEGLRAAGAAVIGTDRDASIADLTAGDDSVGLVADATDPAGVTASVQEAVRRFGGLDILVSNAGVFTPTQPLEQMTDPVWDQSLSLNLTSHLSLLRAAVPFLRHGFEPAVVIMGSKNVPAPGPGAGAYSVAKAGLTQLARVAALELGRDGIRVNVVHPHLVVDTAAWSPEVLAARAKAYAMSEEEYKRNNLLGVEVRVRDVASAVVALVGPAFRVTTGAQIPIDGGNDRVI